MDTLTSFREYDRQAMSTGIHNHLQSTYQISYRSWGVLIDPDMTVVSIIPRSKEPFQDIHITIPKEMVHRDWYSKVRHVYRELEILKLLGEFPDAT
jgi:hypothetical protein